MSPVRGVQVSGHARWGKIHWNIPTRTGEVNSLSYLPSKPKWRWCRRARDSMWMCPIGLWCTATSASPFATTAVPCYMDWSSRDCNARPAGWMCTSGARRMWPIRVASTPSRWPRSSLCQLEDLRFHQLENYKFSNWTNLVNWTHLLAFRFVRCIQLEWAWFARVFVGSWGASERQH